MNYPSSSRLELDGGDKYLPEVPSSLFLDWIDPRSHTFYQIIEHPKLIWILSSCRHIVSSFRWRNIAAVIKLANLYK